MKKNQLTLWSVLISIFTLSISCEDLFSDLTFSVESESIKYNVTIEPTAAGEKIMMVNDVDFDLDSLMDEAGIDKENVEEIKIVKSILKILNTQEIENFDFIQSISLMAINSDNKQSVIAESVNIPDGLNEIEMSILTSVITSMLKDGTYDLYLKVVLEEALEKPLELVGEIGYEAEVKVI